MKTCIHCGKQLDIIYSTDVLKKTHEYIYNKDIDEYEIHTSDIELDTTENFLVECGHCGKDITKFIEI